MPVALLEGTVVAVAADRDHHFRKPLRGSITLIEERGVEGDADAGQSFGIVTSRDDGPPFRTCARRT